MQKVNKHTVLKTVRDNGTWCGYIAPCNVNTYHIVDGWNLGMKLKITCQKNIKGEMVYYCEFGDADNLPMITRKLDDVLSEFQYYNCNSELGKRVSFWQ